MEIWILGTATDKIGKTSLNSELTLQKFQKFDFYKNSD
jgi:hypothetical protein